MTRPAEIRAVEALRELLNGVPAVMGYGSYYASARAALASVDAQPKPTTDMDKFFAEAERIGLTHWTPEMTAAVAKRSAELEESMTSAQPAEPVQTTKDWRHTANEWADMAIEGLQWLRNIADGISDPKDALANMERCLKHCREVNDAAEPVQEPIESALARFESNGHTDELSPLERLRFFCSLAMSGQDWLDVEPFFDALETAEPVQEPVAWANEANLISARLGRERYGAQGACELHTWREGGPTDYHNISLYIAPPTAQRQPLPRDPKNQHAINVPGFGWVAVKAVRAIEQHHGIVGAA